MEKSKKAFDTHPACTKTGYLADPTDVEVPAGFESVVPVVLACNENYAPYAGVAIQSVLENAGPGRFYRVYVLHAGLTDDTIRLLESIKAPQLTVRCLNVEPLVESKGAQLHICSYFSKEAYFRLLIPEVLSAYSQVVYLDCDLVVNRDIADILPSDMGDKLFGAVRDQFDFLMSIYITEQLCLKAENYFNSGVLVFNIGRWNAEETTEKCFAYIRNAQPEQLKYVDQDVLNVVCRDRVLYLDEAWNYYWIIAMWPEPIHRSFVERIGESFYALHFAGKLKPWSRPDLPLSPYFWRYAKNSVFFERILATIGKTAVEELNKQKAETDELKKQNARLQYDLDCVHNSVSYHVGRAITWAPRKVRGGVRCLRDHGAGYTVRRTLYHMGLWEDEETPRGSENRPKLVKHAERILHPKKGK